jgi:prophage maintenance system killer protein
MTDENALVMYQASNGAIELPVDVASETIWASQKQIADVFGVDARTVNEHLQNIFSEDELAEASTIRKFRIVQKEGKRTVEREVNHYNLDAIISVGYRVNSKNATAFRQWATRTLRDYITDGYAINPARIEHNKTQFIKALEDLRVLSAKAVAVGSTEATDLALAFANTWMSLNAYDKAELPTSGTLKQAIAVGVDDLVNELQNLKKQLIASGEATDIFATERVSGGLSSLFHNIFQSFGGEDMYPTIEEKAAHLLYFTVKNHVFIDGNKRSGAYAFVWFLQKAGLLNIHEISPQALTAITLLVAESDPKDKDRMIGLVLLLLGVEGNK